MSQINILVVDDSPGDRRLIEEAIKEIQLPLDHVLLTAEDGIEALQILGPDIPGEAAPIDLIILDLNMPRMNGFQFLETVKNRTAHVDIPVIVLTTSSNESDIFEAYRLKANCYVTKPLDINEFIDTVQKLSDFWMSFYYRTDSHSRRRA